jgi:PAS domain S-box-containing protein
MADPLGLLTGLLSHTRLASSGRAQHDGPSEALSRQSRFLNAVFDNMAEGVMMVDERGRVALWNRAAEAILHMPAPELGYKQWLAQVSIHSSDELRPLTPDETPVARALRGENVDNVHVMVRHAGLTDGVWISVNARPLVDSRGRRRGAVAVFREVTEERAARMAADRAQRDLRRVIEHSPVGIAVVRNDRWIFVNHAMAQALGYDAPEKLIGRKRSEVVHPGDWPQIKARSTEPIVGADGRLEYEMRYRRADGDYAVMESSIAQLAEFDGAPALLVTARNVTERNRLQTQLRVSERLVSVGTLAAGVAHEINSPLAAVLGHLEWLSSRLQRLVCEASAPSEPPLAEQARAIDNLCKLVEPVREAKEAAERVRLIVHDLKVLSRAEEDLRGPVDLTRVLDSASRLAWNEIRHRSRFVKDYPGQLPLAFGNEARLGQVVLNLLINAAQAIPEGQVDRNEIRLTAWPEPSGQVTIEVHDTGLGIPADVLCRIFDPFFTTKPLGVGTGLGLSICHRIVADYGGQIDVQSEPGKGTRFRVVLRVADGHAHRAAPMPQAARPHRRGRVMVLDDDAAIGATLKLILSEWHDVTALTSPREALRMLRAGERYDVVLCDVMMPEMTAMDFHAALASPMPETAGDIVFLTGGAFTVTAREFLDRIPNARFDKPFDLTRLIALVNDRIARREKTVAVEAREPSPEETLEVARSRGPGARAGAR